MVYKLLFGEFIQLICYCLFMVDSD